MLAEKYNNFLIKSHFLGDDIWSLLGSWDHLQRLQKGLVAVTGEVLVFSGFFFPGDLAHRRKSAVWDNAVNFLS